MTQHALIDAGRTFLFDLDGVLIDSSASAARHWGTFAAEHRLDPSAVIARIPGRRAIDSVREFIPDAPEAEIVAAAVAQEQAALTDHDGVIALPGAWALLSALGTTGWAVVTSSPRELATIRLQIAGLPRPPVLIGAEDVGAGKPHAEPYLTAAAQLGADPQHCVVFEDAPAGILAARAAGMQVIALTTSHPASELPGGAELTVPNLASVTIGPCARHDVGGTDGA
jgi:mannitol-1-/sugar-/sorbitol-6-phosphatase